jgi:NADH:ubiquinone oxidoreductase subunit C
MRDDALIARLAEISGSEKVEERNDGLWSCAPVIDIEGAARLMAELGYRLSTMTAMALPQGEAAVIYHYCKPGLAFNLKVNSRGGSLPSIARISLAANWIEREIHDLYAIKFPGHPDLERLVRPPQLEEGFFRGPVGASGPKMPTSRV